MNWKTTKDIPEIGNWILMSTCDEACEYTCAVIGIFMGVCENTNSWRLICAGDKKETLYPVGCVYAWEYESVIANEGFWASNTEPLEVYCANCHDVNEVYAVPYDIDLMEVPLNINTVYRSVEFDWDMVDNECEFHYRCRNCDCEVAKSTVELEEMFLNKCKAKGFLDDEEKMVDFYKLTKDEFLASYSYLTEAEYNATLEEVKKMKGWR